ncbi:hypothetical protein D1007_15617 [Hordeum vulgare]|nr:hypothetical protein D1007_15617 [Hordeum vulgare]
MEVPVQSRVRRDRERVLIDAATVEGIKKRRKVVADGHESEDEENRTDHTMLQYCSDDEENRSGHRVPGFDEHPLTEYEKVSARNMMRNNQIFQSLGIDAIASMIRKTNDVQEGTTNGVQEGSGVISDEPEYNPKEDEVVVHRTIKKALKESRTKRPDVKKTTNKKRKSSEASAGMPPGRVMAPPPGQTMRILEPDEPDRVTRQKATMAAATDHHESPLDMDFESSVEMCDEFSLMDEETTLCMDESGTVHVRLRRGAPSIDRNDVLEMEKMKDAPVPEGQEPKSHAEIVEEVLKTEVKQSTFHRNVGLKLSSNNYGKGTAVVAAHVRASAEAGEVRASS